MRGLFIALLVIHGLVHIIGFLRAFHYLSPKGYSVGITKPLGIFWLITFILFEIAAVMMMYEYNLWWVVGVVAVIISQVLIIYSWNDNKYGTIVNIVILFAIVVDFGSWHLTNRFSSDVSTGLTTTVNIPDTLLVESDIQHLPQLVRKYLQYTGVIGKPKVHNFRIEFNGKIRKDNNSEWMTLTSVQYNFIGASTRLFLMDATMKHIPVTGYHCFKNGTAFMDIRLLSLIQVQYAEGKEMGIAETVTFFNDMCCMAPATLIDKRIQWVDIDSNTVKAIFTNNKISISALLVFNDVGELINFSSNDRYAVSDNHVSEQIPWSTPLKNYLIVDGFKLANNADIIYSYPDGDLCYGKFKLASVQYNCKSL